MTEHRNRVLEPLATLARRHPGHYLGAVVDHLTSMERTVASGDALHHQLRFPIDEDAHAASWATRTTCWTASSMSLRAVIPTPSRMARA